MEGGEKKSRILLAAWIRGIIGSSEAAHAVTGAQREREIGGKLRAPMPSMRAKMYWWLLPPA